MEKKEQKQIDVKILVANNKRVRFYHFFFILGRNAARARTRRKFLTTASYYFNTWQALINIQGDKFVNTFECVLLRERKMFLIEIYGFVDFSGRG